MKIIVDTREQKPLDFVSHLVTEVISCKIDVGDYACQYSDGFVPNIVFERKGLGDLFGTMGKGYDRFKKELKRAQGEKTKVVLLIEAPLARVIIGYKHSTMPGMSVLRKLMTLWVKYGLEFHCFRDRDEMALFILEYFTSIGRLRKAGGRFGEIVKL